MEHRLARDAKQRQKELKYHGKDFSGGAVITSIIPSKRRIKSLCWVGRVCRDASAYVASFQGLIPIMEHEC